MKNFAWIWLKRHICRRRVSRLHCTLEKYKSTC